VIRGEVMNAMTHANQSYGKILFGMYLRLRAINSL